MDQQILDKFLKQSTTKPIYKQYLPFMKLARDCFQQNPIITYWTLCYVVEAALKNQTKPTDEFRKFLMEIMMCLEKEKKSRANDPLFTNEKDAQKFIEEYGNKLVEKAEENEELLEKFDLAYKLYLSASNIFQMYTVFVRDDEENAKRVKFCKWRAVECFKKKKEQEENPQPKPDYADVDESNDDNGGTAASSSSSSCPYPSGSNSCPYPPRSPRGSVPTLFPTLDDDAANEDKKEFNKPTDDEPSSLSTAGQCPTPAPRSTATKPKDNSDSDRQEQIQKELASLKLSESDSKRCELLCESALYAIRANDLLSAVETLKQTLDLLYKRAKK